MIHVRVDPERIDGAAIERAAELLRQGRLVAFPTETVYGLGAHAFDEGAVRGIFEAKGRPSYNPLIVHVASVARARTIAAEWPPTADLLAEAFWPGPLTLVLPKSEAVPALVTASLPSVAIRVPAHPVAHALLDAAAIPVAAPSANRFTRLSPTTAQHVISGLGERVEMVLDSGPTPVGIESTVLDLTGARPRLLRPGSISLPALQGVVGDVAAGPLDVGGTEARPSPGMLDRHYSPRATLRLFEHAPDLRAAAAAALPAHRVGALLLAAGAPEGVIVRRLPSEAAGYARELYAALHALDEAGCDVILVEVPPERPEWAGVRDRLRRAQPNG